MTLARRCLTFYIAQGITGAVIGFCIPFLQLFGVIQ